MPTLEGLDGQCQGTVIPLDKDVVSLGRSSSNDVVLADDRVSRHHARVERTHDAFVLVDNASHNGTFVNDRRISRQILHHEDSIRIGRCLFMFQAPAETDKPSAGPVDLSEDDSAPDLTVVASVKTTEHKQAQELFDTTESRATTATAKTDLARSNKILYVLYQISRELNRTTDFDELLHIMMDRLFEVVHADQGFVALLSDDRREVVYKVIKFRDQPGRNAPRARLSRTILKRVIREKEAVLASNVVGDTRLQAAESLFIQNVTSVLSVPLWRKDEVIGLIQLDSLNLSNLFSKEDLDLVSAVSSQMSMVVEQAHLNEKIRQEEMARASLSRFHSPEVVDLIVRAGGRDNEALMSPSEKMATIIFTDIVGFTSISERLTAPQVSRVLNAYFQVMTDVVFDHSGTLDKYVGDGIMAVFGAPIEREDDVRRAIFAALAMRRALFTLREEFPADQRFDMRFGVNTGRVVAGNLGSPRRMDYTVIGDVVNTASRLESIAAPNQILVGEATFLAARDVFDFKRIGERRVKGKSEPLTVYEVLGARADRDPTDPQRRVV